MLFALLAFVIDVDVKLGIQSHVEALLSSLVICQLMHLEVGT